MPFMSLPMTAYFNETQTGLVVVGGLISSAPEYSTSDSDNIV